MHALKELCEILEDEIQDITKKGDISPTELDNVYKSVDIIKDIKTIEAMKQEYGGGSYEGSYEGGGNSNRYMPYPYYAYENGGGSNSYRGGDGMSNAGRRGMDGDSDGRYSERRGRDSMGRYASREDGYSRNQETEQLRKEMEQMRKKLDRM